MGDKGSRRGAGAPFYAPPRRKTSAEIISEARAAIFSEMNPSSGSSTGPSALRPLRTRRPFTPREPQRTLFTERARKEPRPPSAFDLKYLSLSETSEDALAATGVNFTNLDEEVANGAGGYVVESQANFKKKTLVKPARPQDRSGDGWSGFPKLPHLSGRSKPLHRRNTTGQPADRDVSKSLDLGLDQSLITRPLIACNESTLTSNQVSFNGARTKNIISPDAGVKRKQYSIGKSSSYDTGSITLDEVAVRHLAVQLPNTSHDDYDNMSVLELAEALSQRTQDVDRILLLMDALQRTIDKTCPANSLRDMVLRSLYTHVDSGDERVLVAIARAMLTMRVTGTHLAAACKLVFKIARNDKNDHFFRNSNLLDLLIEGSGRIDPVSESECCVYAAGALRFLALEPGLAALAHRAGALHLAALHLKILNNAKAERPRQTSEQATHALYQVTGALRNLAGGGAGGEFVSSGALAELLAALALHTDRDVLTNVARCLSVLSAEGECCSWLCACPQSARTLLAALAACGARAPLAVRLAYTLGNCAAEDEQARINIYNEEGGVDVLLTILESYTQRSDLDTKDPDSDPDLHLIGSDLGGSDGSNEDVLIKTVRVLANLCLAELAGRGLAANHSERTILALLNCLQLAEKLPDKKVLELSEEQQAVCVERREELATAALAALNNVTFYLEPATPPLPILEKLCKATCRWARSDGTAACEALRALGNLSRCARAAQLLVLEGALDCLPRFQQHEEESVRCSAAGVLVNVCGAGGVGGAGDAADAAADALCGAARARDATAATLLARALWNAHAHRPLEGAQARRAAAALATFIDDDSVFTACEAFRHGDRRASDPLIHKHQHVKFDLDNNNFPRRENKEVDYGDTKPMSVRAYSVEEDLHLEQAYDDDVERYSGEDLGFEEGEVEECDCGPCRRLAAWEELVGVAIPLLEELRPPRTDAAVGTD